MPESSERIPPVFSTFLIQFFVGLFLVVGLLNRQHELTILCLILVSLLGVTRLWSRLSLARITCRCTVDKERVFPGERFNLDVTAQNAKFLPVWLELKIPLSGALISSDTSKRLSLDCQLLWYQRAELAYPLSARRRGYFKIGPPDIKAGDPFGFCVQKKRTETPLYLIVYPRLIQLKPFFWPRREFFGIPAGRSPVQDPVYILGTRDYQNGSPARHIHWKASAHHFRLQEKVFEPSMQDKVFLAIDVERFAAQEARAEFEQTLEVVASLAVDLNRRGYAVGLAANGAIAGGGRTVLPVEGHQYQVTALLELLARLQIKGDRDLTQILARDMVLPWDVSCICFAYEKGEGVSKAAAFLKTRHIPFALVVCRETPLADQDERSFFGAVHLLEDLYLQEEARL